MNCYYLNGENMTTREKAHEEIKRGMCFPDYYGENLDALWDLISCDEAEVVLSNPAPMLNALGSYGCRLLRTFYDAVRENPDFSFRIDTGNP